MSKITGFGSHPTTSGRLMTHFANLDCGHKLYSKVWAPFHPDVQVGNQVSCEECEHELRDLNWLENLDLSTVAHVRFRPQFGGQYHFYRRDASSPTGVLLLHGIKATPAIDALLAKKRLSPLSPTENLGGR